MVHIQTRVPADRSLRIALLVKYRSPLGVRTLDDAEDVIESRVGEGAPDEDIARALALAAEPTWKEGSQLTEEEHGDLQVGLAFAEELGQKSDAELRLMCADAIAEKESAKRDALSAGDPFRFFNERGAQADFEHWGRMERWLVEEATALAFGKAPKVVNSESLRPLLGQSAFAARYRDLLARVQRASETKELGDRPVDPVIFLRWADRTGVEIHSETRAAIHEGSVALQALDAGYARLVEERDALLRDNRDLKEQVKALEKKVAEREVRARERKTFLGIILGMAVHGGYKYKPGSAWGRAPSSITTHAYGVSDEETVRVKLREAAELYASELKARTTDQ